MIAHMNCVRAFLAVVSVVPVLATAGGFSLEMKNPDFKVIIPGLPEMTTFPHPPGAGETSLRSMSYGGPYTVAVKTPKAVSGVTAQQCASSIVEALPQRLGVPGQDGIYTARTNQQTFIAMYRSKVNGRLHAHLLSAAGSNCIEIHASKEGTSSDEVRAWLKAFAEARIEPR